jgi:hypothetical protein
VTKGAEHTMSTDWIPGAGVGLVGSAIAWLLSWRINSAKLEGQSEAKEKADTVLSDARAKAEMVRSDDLRADLRVMRDDWRQGIDRVGELAANISALQSSQNVVNTMTSKAIDSMCDKQDRLEQVVADHTATLRLLTEVVMSKKEAAK